VLDGQRLEIGHWQHLPKKSISEAATPTLGSAHRWACAHQPVRSATIDVLEDLGGALRAGTSAERARHIKNMADAERRAEESRRRQIDERLDSL
jgi:hypothetical protein